MGFILYFSTHIEIVFLFFHFFLPAILTVLSDRPLSLIACNIIQAYPLTFNFSIVWRKFFSVLYLERFTLASFFSWRFIAFLYFFTQITYSHSINYVEAEPLVTPPHIVPEWYFLPFLCHLKDQFQTN